MTRSQTVEDCLRRAFEPARRGVVGLTEQLLEAFAGGDVEFERVGDRCVCRWDADGGTQETTVPLPPAAFRTILARIAMLCIERSPNSVTPYRGESLLTVDGGTTKVVRVAFVNTPEKQQLNLKSVSEKASAGGGDQQSLVESSRMGV